MVHRISSYSPVVLSVRLWSQFVTKIGFSVVSCLNYHIFNSWSQLWQKQSFIQSVSTLQKHNNMPVSIPWRMADLSFSVLVIAQTYPRLQHNADRRLTPMPATANHTYLCLYGENAKQWRGILMKTLSSFRSRRFCYQKVIYKPGFTGKCAN